MAMLREALLIAAVLTRCAVGYTACELDTPGRLALRMKVAVMHLRGGEKRRSAELQYTVEEFEKVKAEVTDQVQKEVSQKLDQERKEKELERRKSRNVARKRVQKQKGQHVPSTKNRIRSLERTLQRRADRMPDETKQQIQEKLRLLREEYDQVKLSLTEREMATKYRKVKFWERKKLHRLLSAAQRKLPTLEPGSEEHEKLLERARALKEDLEYVVFFPRDMKYVSILRNPRDVISKLRSSPEFQEKQQRAREVVLAYRASKLKQKQHWEKKSAEGEHGQAEDREDDGVSSVAATKETDETEEEEDGTLLEQMRKEQKQNLAKFEGGAISGEASDDSEQAATAALRAPQIDTKDRLGEQGDDGESSESVIFLDPKAPHFKADADDTGREDEEPAAKKDGNEIQALQGFLGTGDVAEDSREKQRRERSNAAENFLNDGDLLSSDDRDVDEILASVEEKGGGADASAEESDGDGADSSQSADSQLHDDSVRLPVSGGLPSDEDSEGERSVRHKRLPAARTERKTMTPKKEGKRKQARDRDSGGRKSAKKSQKATVSVQSQTSSPIAKGTAGGFMSLNPAAMDALREATPAREQSAVHAPIRSGASDNEDSSSSDPKVHRREGKRASEHIDSDEVGSMSVESESLDPAKLAAARERLHKLKQAALQEMREKQGLAPRAVEGNIDDEIDAMIHQGRAPNEDDDEDDVEIPPSMRNRTFADLAEVVAEMSRLKAEELGVNVSAMAADEEEGDDDDDDDEGQDDRSGGGGGMDLDEGVGEFEEAGRDDQEGVVRFRPVMHSRSKPPATPGWKKVGREKRARRAAGGKRGGEQEAFEGVQQLLATPRPGRGIGEGTGQQLGRAQDGTEPVGEDASVEGSLAGVSKLLATPNPYQEDNNAVDPSASLEEERAVDPSSEADDDNSGDSRDQAAEDEDGKTPGSPRTRFNSMRDGEVRDKSRTAVQTPRKVRSLLDNIDTFLAKAGQRRAPQHAGVEKGEEIVEVARAAQSARKGKRVRGSLPRIGH